MRVLVVQNFDGTGLGQVGAALVEAGAEIVLCAAYRGEHLPTRSDGFDALAIFGGGQNALADQGYPYFPHLLDLIRDFHAREKALLGICLGSQLIARALGGENRIGGATEFGWCEVTLTDQGKADPMLREMAPSFPIFQWHDDTFTLPPGASHLATSAVARSQAFRIGRATYGIQFHFEAHSGLVRQWTKDFAPVIADRHPDWLDRFESFAAIHGPRADAAGLVIARAWVARIAG